MSSPRLDVVHFFGSFLRSKIIERGDLEMYNATKCLLNNPHDAMKYAVRCNLEIVNDLYSQGYDFSYVSISDYSFNPDIRIFEFLIQRGIKRSPYGIKCAIASSNRELALRMRDEGFPLDSVYLSVIEKRKL